MTQLSEKEVKDIMTILSEHEYALEDCPQYSDYKQVVVNILDFDGAQLEFVSYRLKCDIEVIVVALKNTISAYKYIPEEIKNNKDKMLEIIEKRSLPLEWLNNVFQEDEDIVLALAKSNYASMFFKNLPDKFKNNKAIALAAVHKNALNIQYIPKKFLTEDLALSAVQQYGEVIIHIPKTIPNYDQIVLEAVKNEGYCLEYLDEKYKDNKQLVLIAVSNSDSLKFVSDNLKDDKEIVLKAIDFTFSAYEYASDRLKHDKEVILLALTKDDEELKDLNISSAYFHVPQSIKLEIGDNNSISYLKAAILKEKIEHITNDIPTINSNIKKIKI